MSISLEHWPRIVLAALGVAGLTSAVLGLAGIIPIEGVPAGATAIAASVAGLVALSSVVTWTETRKRQIEAMQQQHREEVYEAFMTHVVSRFVLVGWDPNQAALLRAKISVWAAAETLQMVAEWHSFTYSVAPHNGTQVSLPPDKAAAGRHIVGNLALAMRRDLGESKKDQPPLSVVIASIFNA